MEGKTTLDFVPPEIAMRGWWPISGLVSGKTYAEKELDEEVTQMAKDAKKIAKALVKELRKLDREGELARDGKKVAAAINNLREERRLTPRELNRRATI